jgi:hypothetical protein
LADRHPLLAGGGVRYPCSISRAGGKFMTRPRFVLPAVWVAMHDTSRHVTAPARRLPSVPRVSPIYRETKPWWPRKIAAGMNKPLSLTSRSWARRPRSAIPRLREIAARIVTKELSAQPPGTAWYKVATKAIHPRDRVRTKDVYLMSVMG